MNATRTTQPTSSSLSASQLWVFFLASLGGTLEYYDFIIFVFFTPFISKLFFPASMPEWLRQFQTFGIFAVGYLARPLGGIVMAHFGDLRGRKKVFMLTVLLMAIPTFAIGLLPTYKTIGVAAPLLLLTLRITQGLAIGGDVPAGCVFVAEHAKEKAGLAVGLFMAGVSGGVVVGAAMTALIIFKFPQVEILAGVWRLPFLLGGVFGLAATLLRRYLAETPIFQEMQRRAKIAREIPLRVILRDHKAAVAASLWSGAALSVFVIVMLLMTPVLLQKMYHLTPAATQFANLIGSVGTSTGGIFVGLAVNRFGLRRVIVPLSILSIPATYALYLGPRSMPTALPWFYLAVGLLAGALAMAPLVMVRAFPASVRFSGVSFAYNVGNAVFNGMSLILVSWLTHYAPLFPAHYVTVMILVAVAATVLAPVARAEY